MNSLLHCRLMLTFSIAAYAGSLLSGVAIGQERGSRSVRSVEDRVKIQPYTGPPIFLDEREEVVPPRLVGREKLTENFQDSDTLRVEREVAKFSDNHYEADGIYREYYPSGQRFVEGTFRRGRQEGEWTYYHDNGQVNRKATYKQGQPDGAWEIYRADGTLAAKRAYADGKRDGEWITYGDGGEKPIREEHYADGKADGTWKVWFANGNLRQEFAFKDGERHGQSTEWDENGNERAQVNYVEGKLDGTATFWAPDGRKVVQQYEAGRLVSEKKE